MSRKRSTSVLDIPATPLLDPPPGHESPFSQEEEEDVPQTPSPLQEDSNRRKKKGFACAGIAVLGLVIVGALIFVAVKQSQPRDSADVERQRDLSTTTSTIPTLPTTISPSMDDDNLEYQQKLRELDETVNKCKEVSKDDKLSCDEDLDNVNEKNIDEILSNLRGKINDTILSKNLDELMGLPNLLENKTLTEENTRKIENIITDLKLVMEEEKYVPVNTSAETLNPRSLNNTERTKYEPVVEIVCDDVRERRCRDKSGCYPIQKHCDFEVDCKDNSDEDSCTCLERLIDDRKCDAFIDCEGATDENDCGCNGDDFFCAPHPAFGPPECINSNSVCDGVIHCSNGRDEKDCLILGPSPGELKHDSAGSSGILAQWSQEEGKYLPVGVEEDGAIDEYIKDMSVKACIGVVGSNPSVEVGPISSNYEGRVAVFDEDQGVMVMPKADYNVVYVECGEMKCGTSSARVKREVVLNRVKRSDTYNQTCDEIIAHLNEAERESFKNSEVYRTRFYKAYNCTIGDTDAKIVGGDVSYPEKWPYTVALYRDGQFICGATIISPEWVITAGHCVYGYDEGSGHFYQIRAGMVRRQSQAPWQQFRHIVEVFIHPEYDNTYLKHDVALSKLNAPFNINRHVQAICLPHDANMYPEVGSTCMATGWGDISEDGPSSEELREVEVPILKKCGRSYNNITYQICGGYTEGGKDACQGDSGGPLYCKDSSDNWYLGGVISHGRGCARASEAGVYVRLAYYMDWVEEVLSGMVLVQGSPKEKCGGLVCGSGECVPDKWLCDLTVDCLDGGDVLGCVTLDNGTRVQMLEDTSTLESSFGTGIGISFGFLTQDKNQFALSNMSCQEGEFKCSTLSQCVPSSSRCDGVRDCPDWSDEKDCVCGDKISLAMVCDGTYDCRDLSDEEGCELCRESEWRCPLSGECVAGGAQCDTVIDCKWEEDERFCTALTQEVVLPVTSTGDVVPVSQGMLLMNQNDAWQPLCAVQFGDTLASRVCKYMGWSDGLSHELIPPSLSLFNNSVEGDVDDFSCYHVSVVCEDDNCGLRSMYRNLPPSTTAPQSGPGSWPWQANFFSDGEYICGGSIVHHTFVLTDLSCAQLMIAAGRFITVLVGQEKRTSVGLSPYSQIRKVTSLKVVQDSTIVLAQLDEKLNFNEHVNQLCLPEDDLVSYDSCMLSGMSGDVWTKTLATVASTCSTTETCLSTSAPTPDTSSWSGALACTSGSSEKFYAVGLYHSQETTPPSRVTSLSNLMIEDIGKVISAGLAAPPSSPPDTCQGLRCSLGNCVKEENICDRTWDCQEGEDEADCDAMFSTSLSLCEVVGSGPQCNCMAGQGKCSNNLCLDQDKWCDGVDDCGDGSDEVPDCDRCVSRLALVSPSSVCDSVPDCPDMSDETSQACGCAENSFRCSRLFNTTMNTTTTSPTCIPLQGVCDGIPDCEGGTDEDPAQCIALSTHATVQQDLLLAPVHTNVGTVKARTYGVWYTYCAVAWTDSASTLVCRAMGYSDMLYWTMEDVNQVDVIGGEDTTPADCSAVFLTCSQQ